MGGVDVKLKRINASYWMALLTVVGLCAALAGVYLLAGLAVTLLTGGALAAAFGLLVDV